MIKDVEKRGTVEVKTRYRTKKEKNKENKRCREKLNISSGQNDTFKDEGIKKRQQLKKSD